MKTNIDQKATAATEVPWQEGEPIIPPTAKPLYPATGSAEKRNTHIKQRMNWAIGNPAVCLAHGSEEFEISETELAAVLAEYTPGPGVDRQMAAERIAEERTLQLPHVQDAIRKHSHGDYGILVTSMAACACYRG